MDKINKRLKINNNLCFVTINNYISFILNFVSTFNLFTDIIVIIVSQTY